MRRWLDKVKDDIKEKRLSADEVYDRAIHGVCHRTSTPHNSGSKMNEKIKYFNTVVTPNHSKPTIKQINSLRLSHYSQQQFQLQQ